MLELKPKGVQPDTSIDYRKAAEYTGRIIAEIAGSPFSEGLVGALQAMTDEQAKEYYETVSAIDRILLMG